MSFPTHIKQHTFTIRGYSPRILNPETKNQPPIYPTPTNPYPASNDPIFTDAMHVRDAVFVREQGCRAEEEIDTDDARSWGWVVYSSPPFTRPSSSSSSEKKYLEIYENVPVGTIRLVPPPHAPHELHEPMDMDMEGENSETKQLPSSSPSSSSEPYIKITRVAILPSFRGYGLSRLMMSTAEQWARRNKKGIDQLSFTCRADSHHAHVTRFESSESSEDGATGMMHAEDNDEEERKSWNGLIGLHAQIQVEKMYASMGYETDISMGKWDEEGILHVGMFKRVSVLQEG